MLKNMALYREFRDILYLVINNEMSSFIVDMSSKLVLYLQLYLKKQQ